jgi:NAD(P)-dependent dehydrogenase (short-subunit alcohol dehydrogenase family)
MSLQPRTVLITGSSSGIGRAIAERLLDKGHRVVGFARDHEKFQPDTPAYVPERVDMTQPDEVAAAVNRVLEGWPEFDAVISNAGVGSIGSLEEFSFRQIQEAMEINLLSHLYLSRAVIPHLRKRGRGDLIFMGSEASRSGAQKGSLYCAAKFGLRGLAQSLRQECARSGVRVMAVHPGMVRTPFFDPLKFQPGPSEDNAIRPEDVAEVVDTMLGLPPGTVMDEVDLSPLKKVVMAKNKGS